MYFWEQPPLWLQVLGGVGPLIGAVVAFLVDKRTGHGYGLALLAIAAGAVAIGATLTIQEVQQTSIGREGLGPGVLMIFVLFYQLAWAIIVSLVGLGLAVTARQWIWLIGIGVGLVIMLSTLLLSRSGDPFGPLGSAPFALVLSAPLYPCLAYGLRRIVLPHEWPVKPA